MLIIVIGESVFHNQAQYAHLKCLHYRSLLLFVCSNFHIIAIRSPWQLTLLWRLKRTGSMVVLYELYLGSATMFEYYLDATYLNAYDHKSSKNQCSKECARH